MVKKLSLKVLLCHAGEMKLAHWMKFKSDLHSWAQVPLSLHISIAKLDKMRDEDMKYCKVHYVRHQQCGGELTLELYPAKVDLFKNEIFHLHSILNIGNLMNFSWFHECFDTLSLSSFFHPYNVFVWKWKFNFASTNPSHMTRAESSKVTREQICIILSSCWAQHWMSVETLIPSAELILSNPVRMCTYTDFIEPQHHNIFIHCFVGWSIHENDAVGLNFCSSICTAHTSGIRAESEAEVELWNSLPCTAGENLKCSQFSCIFDCWERCK